MDADDSFDLTEMVPEFPNKPEREISRDPFIRWVTKAFGRGCQKQLVVSGPLTGKTNFIAQFAQYHRNRVISYFISSNPLTQEPRTFLYVICNQIARVLGQPDLLPTISLQELKALYSVLAMGLQAEAKRAKATYFFAVDGLDWAVQGEKGSRIIDFPLISFSASPFLLCTCSPDKRDSLDLSGYTVREDVSNFLEFSLSDIGEFLADLQLSHEELASIQRRAKGLPGYVKIVRDTIQTAGKDWISAGNLPDSLRSLVEGQLTLVQNSLPPEIMTALELIAIAPKPLPLQVLSELVRQPTESLLNELQRTSLVVHDKSLGSLHIGPDYTRQVLLRQLGERRASLSALLIGYYEAHRDHDPIMVTLLMQGLDDYEGVSKQLESSQLVAAYAKSRDASSLSRQLHVGADMAYHAANLGDLIRWNSALAIAKSLLAHQLSFDEVSALISVGSSEEALKLAYSTPHAPSRIRLLAQAYTAMKENGTKVPASAREELTLLLEGLDHNELERDEMLQLATDLFPVLPDAAAHLLEARFFSTASPAGILESALAGSDGSTRAEIHDDETTTQTSAEFKVLASLDSDWLIDVPLEELQREVEELHNTRAKDYLIRAWCTQNKPNQRLHAAIQLWIDTVVADNGFTISLESLRKVSSLLRFTPPHERMALIRQLQIPAFNSIRTPWEEWVGYHLNLAEASFEQDAAAARTRIEEIYDTINLEISDMDVKIFCYARLWAAAKLCHEGIAFDVKMNFERVLSALLHHSALHEEILGRALRIIAPLDIEYALEKAADMNTAERRTTAMAEILTTSLRKNPSQGIAGYLGPLAEGADERELVVLMQRLTSVLAQRKVGLSEANQAALLRYARKITDHSARAQVIAQLAAVWTNAKLIRCEKLIKEAINAWEREDDLKFKIFLGYDLVRHFAKRDKLAAADFLDQVRALRLLPGATLAGGDLGKAYFEFLWCAIQALSLGDISSNTALVETIQDQVSRIAASVMRARLYGELAARAFTVGYPSAAISVIETKILPEIAGISDRGDKARAIYRCLPVVFRYRPDKAVELTKDLPSSMRSSAWMLTSLWSLKLGSVDRGLDIEHLKVVSDYPSLKDFALVAAKRVTRDQDIAQVVIGMSKVVERSATEHKIDLTQAYSVLSSLDEFCEASLPDQNNIQHKGYLVVCLATINGARSALLKHAQQGRAQVTTDVRRRWDELVSEARGITNTADKVFVMQWVGKQLAKSNDSRASALLEEADGLVDSIPALVDRADRLEEIGTAWSAIGKKSAAEYTFQRAQKLVEQMTGLSQDKRLELLVQATYELNPRLAESMVQSYGSRFPDDVLSPARLHVETQKLAASPELILRGYRGEQDTTLLSLVMSSTASRLYTELVCGHGRVAPENVLLEWIRRSFECDQASFFRTLNWVQECINGQSLAKPKYELASAFVDLTGLILKLATLVSPTARDGIPDAVIGMLPGLSSRVFIARVGEFEKIRNWIRAWIRKYAQDYLKIVDPYFEPEDMLLLSEVPSGCKLLVVTTDEHLATSMPSEQIIANMETVWRQHGKGSIPPTNMIIVPRSLRETFHARTIITVDRGLDLDQSLNGLGKQLGRITDLAAEDARELESKYVDDMLNNNRWFLGHSIRPRILSLGLQEQGNA